MNYVGLRDNLAIPKLLKYGKAVSLRRPGNTTGWIKAWIPAEGRYKWTFGGTPPPDVGTVVYSDPALVPVDIAGHAVEKAYKQREIDNTTVFAADRRFITADLPAPTTADKLVVGSSILTIVNVIPVQPGDTTIVNILQCRGV
jgi:hypothetical protein